MQNKIAFISDNFLRYQSLLRNHSPENLVINMLTFPEAKARCMSNIFFNLYIIDTTHIKKKLPKWIMEIAKQDYFFRVILITPDTPSPEFTELFSDHLYATITHEQAELTLRQIIDNVWQSILTRNYDKKEVS
jgi:hypothetical protein